MNYFKNYPIYVYSNEALYRFLYVLLSGLFCLGITIYHSELIFLFEVYPVVKLSYKKFLATHVTDLFNSIWVLSFYISYITIYPLVIFQVSSFFKSCWYNYQIKLFNKINLFFWISFLLFFLLSHYLVFPHFLSFLLQWEKNDTFLLLISVESRIYTYVLWLLSFNFFLSFNFSLILTTIFFSLWFLNSRFLYSLLKRRRKVIIFLIVLLAFLIIPVSYELAIQLIVIIGSFILYELFFFSCIKLQLSRYKDAYHKTVIEKPT